MLQLTCLIVLLFLCIFCYSVSIGVSLPEINVSPLVWLLAIVVIALVAIILFPILLRLLIPLFPIGARLGGRLVAVRYPIGQGVKWLKDQLRKLWRDQRGGSRPKVKVPSSIEKKWHKSTSKSVIDSVRYHWAKHARPHGKSLNQYTRDAEDFFRQNHQLGEKVILNDGTEGVLIRIPGGSGGYFTSDGKIVTFWYR